MKLAEALANRADLQRRIEQMREASESALVQEGENRLRTHRSFSMRRRLVTELGEYAAAHQQDEPLRDSRRRRDDAHGRSGAPRRLTLRYGTLKTLVSTASDRLPLRRAEIHVLPPPWVGPLRRRMDELAREGRELDTSIQQANWAVDLTEG